MNRPASNPGFTVTEDAPLAERNTLRVRARARRLVEVLDAAALPEALALPAVRTEPLLVLGQGSNVLFTDDFQGSVVTLATRGVTLEDAGDATRIAVAAGEIWDDLVRWTLSQGHAGLENLVLIPGSVGAAPMQNIGAYGRELAEFVESVEAWDRQANTVVMLERAACRFAYRDSLFKRVPQRYIITALRLRLPRQTEPRLDYAGLRAELQRMGVARPTPFHVADAVVNLRTRKLPDPAVIGNAGSFFKNPVVAAERADRLLGEHGPLPHWEIASGGTKLSAAWMIEACGFKGLREGDAGISRRHALVLVNHGQASGAELWALAQRVIAGVEDRFGVTLEPEPRIIGTA